MTLTIDLLTPKCIGTFLLQPSIYVWNMKAVRWKLLKWSCQNQSVDKVPLWLWPLDPKMLRYRPLTILHLCIKYESCTFTLDTRPTSNQFLWLGRVWSGKKVPALIEEPRSTPAVPALYPWYNHAQIPLFPTYPRPSGWPIPALHDQSRPIPDATTLTTLNIGQPPICMLDFHSWPQMNNLSKCNANRQSY